MSSSFKTRWRVPCFVSRVRDRSPSLLLFSLFPKNKKSNSIFEREREREREREKTSGTCDELPKKGLSWLDPQECTERAWGCTI